MWLRDSSEIVYDDKCNIWRINDRKKKQLTTDGGQYPIWSPCGNKIVYLKENGIWLMDKDGNNKFQVLQLKKKTWIRMLSWLTSEDKIIFASNEEFGG